MKKKREKIIKIYGKCWEWSKKKKRFKFMKYGSVLKSGNSWNSFFKEMSVGLDKI